MKPTPANQLPGRFALNHIPHLAAVAVVVMVASVASVASADPKPWDEKDLERLTLLLSRETGTLQDNLAEVLNVDDKTAPQFVVVQAVHDIHIRSISLESAIRARRPHDAITAIFRRLKAEIDLAKEDAKTFPQIENQLEHIDRAEKLVAEIGQYF